MTMLHLRVISAPDVADAVVEELGRHVGVVAIRRAGRTTDGEEITAALARECADAVFTGLRVLGVYEHGMVSLEPLDTAVGHLAEKAEGDAPGEGADALIWDELTSRTGEDSTLTGTYLAFITLATVLAAIGVVTDSQVTIVGAMVVGPEFGPLAAVAVGLIQRRLRFVRRAAIALLVGFPFAIVVTSLLSLIAHAGHLIDADDITNPHRQTQFIYHPGWFSLITALVAGTAGMLSLTSSKSAALVGVFISVTTIPAAGNAAVGGVLGQWDETWQSVAQLGINLVGIVAAGVVTLLVLRRIARARAA
jgi:uncharacterized hydrophobic protein (TIGR00271 family)